MTEPPDHYRIVIVCDVADYAKNAINWSSDRAGKQFSGTFRKARRLARAEWRRLGCPRYTGRVVANFHVIRSTGDMLDEANIAFAMGGFIDGLFCKAITPDDAPRYLKFGQITQESEARHRSREALIVTVQPLEAQLWPI